ncbi:glycosyltransferase involved in cell wall biosynthesis [Desulfosalsimonas propionicica]|uniref:Glycosyltransferase involved in cell wall biosynthesis n=1 Tax=Desulfosalsimonas propionicica TaxID=332175 RepID=A0A7W0HKQ7_9BACT|nr:glycosyltransferase family 4 protein [Desulfosalsimonas propionicica]MBA2881477.1 glycosyltransferase involved in cell wall biosynthesis [Desulfosalsimonas propionicica]
MQKPRLLWIAFKLIDKSENRVVLLQMIERLNQHFDVRLIAGYSKEALELQAGGRPVEYYDRHGRIPLKWLRAYISQPSVIKRLIRSEPPAIIFVTHGPSNRMLRFILKNARKYGAKVVFDVRTLPGPKNNSRSFKLFSSRLLFASRHFSGVTYITEEMRRYCIKRFGLPDHKSAVWTSGVDADTFRPADLKPADTPFRLIYHGGIISAARGLDRLIQAMDYVKDLDIHLTLISSLREPEAICWIERLKLQDRVTLVDTIPHAQIPAQIQAHHAGILPFPDCDMWNTSSPIKLFEYMACGLPVIATQIPAHRNVLNGKPFAFFAKDASPQALAAAIRQAYSQKKRFEELGNQARAQVLEEHTWNSQAVRLSNFLRSYL